MKETSFIEQNKEKWKKFQSLTSNQTSDPEEIADLYSDITDDLSYAQTFYSKRTVRVYLNQIAQGIHNLVHKQRKDSFKKLFTVWRVSIPLEIYRSRKNLLFALFIFLFWSIVGAISTHFNPDFPRMIMGDRYVEVTLRNIEKGDPLGIYHSGSQISMFLEITLNNITVSFYTFIAGILFTVGTHILIFNNSIMLGAFQYFFHLKGLLLASFLGIWIHGAFEISSIAIAGGAGITLGNGLLFPGSYTRLQSLQLSAKRGLKIMMSLVPFLIVAGFLESFVTHKYQELAEWSKWAIITISFAIIIFYYIIFPIVVARRFPELVHESNPPIKTYKNVFDLNKIRNFGQIFSDSFSFYRVHIGKIMRYNLVLTIPIIIAIVIFQDLTRYDELTHQYEYDWASQLSIIMGFGVESISDVVVTFLWTIILSIFTISILYHFKFQEEKASLKAFLPYMLQKLPATWLGLSFLFLILFYLPWYWMFLVLFIAPFFWLQASSIVLGEERFGKRFKNGFGYGTKNYGNVLLGISLMSLVLFIFAQPIACVLSYQEVNFMRTPIQEDLLDKLADFVKNVSRYYMADFMVPANIVRQIFYVLFILFTLPLFVIMMGFQFYTCQEQNLATGLKKQFSTFGKRKRYQETSLDFD
ncbi:stage II sporulation protein M [Fluviicola taffensis]|uniref:Stage II sporulation protein M n=1 Tax=Fluviicola taffensis (strain DSM 16823 / NCIMB 13979 / RW262) TaxID=755732 RepID=F2IC31_FLUTR|nr:stage II sporulation protein M [Fluviicola taffensis]AEA43257.1 protein of unknown function DUF95 transmembrane [Fluviicola taffensis DSM 16823]